MPYQLSRLVAGPVLRAFGRPRLIDGGSVPASGPAILASNHLSVIDSVYLPLLLSRPVTFPAKAEYFTARGPARRAWAAYLRSTSQLTIDRDDPRAAQATLDAALKLLRDGQLLGFYPEGTRSPDGRLYRGRAGIGYLVLRSGAPVVPVAMTGTRQMLPPGSRVPRPHRIEVRVGEPMTFDDVTDLPPARARGAIADQVMAAIARLSGQEYVHVYASARKAQLAERSVVLPRRPAGNVGGSAEPGAYLACGVAHRRGGRGHGGGVTQPGGGSGHADAGRHRGIATEHRGGHAAQVRFKFLQVLRVAAGADVREALLKRREAGDGGRRAGGQVAVRVAGREVGRAEPRQQHLADRAAVRGGPLADPGVHADRLPAIHHRHRDGLGPFEHAEVARLAETRHQVTQRRQRGAAQVAAGGGHLAEHGELRRQPVPALLARHFQVAGGRQRGGQPGGGGPVYAEFAGDFGYRYDGAVPGEHVKHGQPVQQGADDAVPRWRQRGVLARGLHCPFRGLSCDLAHRSSLRPVPRTPACDDPR